MHLALLIAVLAGTGVGVEAQESTSPASGARAAEAEGQDVMDTRPDAIAADGPEAEAFLEADPSELSQKLAALGMARYDALFAILSDGRFPVLVGDQGHSFKKLSTAQREALVTAFARLPYEAVRSRLAELESAPVSERLVAFQILGAVARAEDLGLCLRLAAPAAGSSRVNRTLREAFGATFEALVVRWPSAAQALTAQFRDLHASLIANAVSALGRRPTESNVTTLSELLGRRPEADVLILIELGRAAAFVRHPLDERIYPRLEPYLQASDPQFIVEAALAAEKIGDRRAVSVLAELLGHELGNVRERAHAALLALTKKQIAPVAARWSEWYREEERWWSEERGSVEHRLATGSQGEVARLVLELSKRYVLRHEVTALLVPVLERGDPELVVLTCATLGHLGSDTSIAPLVELLDESVDDELRASAWRALRRITGRDIGPEADLWRAAFAG